MGWSGRAISETAGLVEEAIYFQRRENYSNSEYIVKHAYILDVLTPNAKSGESKVGENSKGLLVGRGCFGEEASLS